MLQHSQKNWVESTRPAIRARRLDGQRPPIQPIGFSNCMDISPLPSGTLYVVATPIGNLRDITLRALDVLASVDVIAAEDTRTTANLLAHHSIGGTRTMALHRHNEHALGERIVELLARGQSVALVTDAGTPAISDPGAMLIAFARSRGHRVVPVPGANAAVCALSASGIIASRFIFYGFLPAGSAMRRRELELLKPQPYTLVFHEAPHRILECVADLSEVLGAQRQLVIARELTKLFETFHRCRLDEASAWLQADSNRCRGEFVLLVEGAAPAVPDEIGEQARKTLSRLLEHLPLRQAVALATEITGESRKRLYALALVLKRSGPKAKDSG